MCEIRELTEKEKKEYESMVAHAYQMELVLSLPDRKPKNKSKV